MHEDKYYKALGLTPGASEKEVRKKYRRLVMIYHPDKNDSPDAEQKFIEITDAYEILTGKKKPTRSQLKGQDSTVTKQESHEERIKQAKKRYREQILREFLENDTYYNELTKGPKWKTIKVLAFLGVIMSTLLIADYVLPRHYEPSKVVKYHVNAGVLGADKKELSLIQMEDGKKYWISRLTYHMYGKFPSGYVETSWIFHNPISVISEGKTTKYRYFIHFTFYSFGWLTAIMFLVPTLLFIYRKKTVRFTVLYHFSYYGVGILMLIFLLTGDRWAHLLSLGLL